MPLGGFLGDDTCNFGRSRDMIHVFILRLWWVRMFILIFMATDSNASSRILCPAILGVYNPTYWMADSCHPVRLGRRHLNTWWCTPVQAQWRLLLPRYTSHICFIFSLVCVLLLSFHSV